jgi:hypothetical protein
MRWLVLIVLIVILGLVSYQVFELRKQEADLVREAQVAEERLQGAVETRDNLRAQLQIYADPELAEKEIRRRFNYRLPDEKMMIVIPEHATSS